MNTPCLSALALLALASPLLGLQINRILPHESDPSLYWWETAELSESGDYTLLSRTLSSELAATGKPVFPIETRSWQIPGTRYEGPSTYYVYGAARAYGFYIVPAGVSVPAAFEVYGTMAINDQPFQIIRAPLGKIYPNQPKPDDYLPPFCITDPDQSFDPYSTSPFWSQSVLGWVLREPLFLERFYVMGLGVQLKTQGGAEGFWAYFSGDVMGWVWTRQDYHPWFYHYETGSWFYHWTNTSWCWSLQSGQWQVGVK